MKKKILFTLLIILNINTVFAKDRMVDYIKELYNNSNKQIVTNNSIEYNYATSVNLMNDRLGGITSLDGGNIRYYGAEPNNYIDIGDRTSDNEVILWRIIGVFDGKLRIRRDENIGGIKNLDFDRRVRSYSFDTSSSIVNNGDGINEWSQADLMKLLNPGYENNRDESCVNCKYDSSTGETTCDCTDNTLVNNSLWWNSESGICYSDFGNITKECDFTSYGLSTEAKKYVVDQTLYLGGFETEEVFANDSYVIERGNNVFNNTKSCYGQSYCNDTITRTLTWTGKVGLIYPSDFGYATDFRDSNCQNTINNINQCSLNWMNDGSSWTISSLVDDATLEIFTYSFPGYLSLNKTFAFYDHGAWPVLTLSPDAIKLSGTGTKDDPFVIGDEPKYSATINYYGEDGKLLTIDNNPYVIDNLPSGYKDTIKVPKVSGCYAKNVVINITDKDEVYDVYYNCSVIVNPKTGRILSILGIILGIGSISYLLYYIKNKKEVFD